MVPTCRLVRTCLWLPASCFCFLLPAAVATDWCSYWLLYCTHLTTHYRIKLGFGVINGRKSGALGGGRLIRALVLSERGYFILFFCSFYYGSWSIMSDLPFLRNLSSFWQNFKACLPKNKEVMQLSIASCQRIVCTLPFRWNWVEWTSKKSRNFSKILIALTQVASTTDL